MIKNITHSTERELQIAVNTLNDAIGYPSWYMFEMNKYWNLEKEEITTVHLVFSLLYWLLIPFLFYN